MARKGGCFWGAVDAPMHTMYYINDKLSEKGTELILELVKYTWFSDSLLPLARVVHCLLKKSLKMIALAL